MPGCAEYRDLSLASLKLNTIANFAGRGWTALLAFLFIPIYINVLGIESWGLIGFFTTLLAILNLLDMGLSSTLNRELARLSARRDTNREQRDLMRTLETIYWIVAVLFGLLAVSSAPVLARYWINSQDLPVETVTGSVRMMGLVFTFQFPFALYRGGLMGLQRQVLLNGVLAGMGTLRSLGAVAVIWWISPTIQAFFIWQLLVSALQTFAIRSCLWRLLPRDATRPRFRKASLLAVWRFAAGMTGIAMVTVFLTNLDKVLLSKLLTLEKYGYYMVGASATIGIYMLVAPFYIAAFPRFSQMVAAEEHERAARLYHLLCQAVAVVVLPVVAVVSLFSPEALMIWTRNPAIVENSHLFVTLLVIGTGLNGLMNIPYAFQLANGWTKLAFYQNVVSVIVVVPALIISTRLYGGFGAAVIWVALNASWVLITPHIMHRRLLPTEKWRWYIGDVAKPLLGVVVAAGVVRLLVPLEMLGLWTQFLVLGAACALAVVAAISLAPSLRGMLFKTLNSYGKMLNV